MIKVEVVFDGDSMFVNGFQVFYSETGYHHVEEADRMFDPLEDAIKYCLEKEDE